MISNTLRWLRRHLLSVYLVASLVRLLEISDAIQLKTSSSRIVGVGSEMGGSNGVKSLQDFISHPTNWPEIVLSSNRVELIKSAKKDEAPKLFSFLRAQGLKSLDSKPVMKTPDEALEKGDTVVEYFALNQFKVEWTCTTNEPGRLIVVSPDGVPGIATNCVMDFEFVDAADAVSNAIDDSTAIQLTMKYTPESLVAVFATPVLALDNWLALNVLLPVAIDTRPLDSFRKLMGFLYGLAGAAHLLDLLVGGSQLFTNVMGISPFENLSTLGQIYALVWCAVGPFAYYLSVTALPSINVTDRTSSIFNKADIGLLLYGIIELAGASLCSGFSGAAPDVVSNAFGVQAIVLAAWVYSYQKQQQQLGPQPEIQQFS